MNRLNKRKIKRPHVKEYSYADTRGEKPDYSYVYIPINKKEKYHRSHTKRLLAKKINKRFDAVEKDDYYTNIRSERWRMLKTNYDAYMNISPAERRTVSTNNMRGYQYDQFTKVLYSFEDGCVYSTQIDPVLNKINVIRKLHDMSDIEKRSVYDNPIKYIPVSPFRIRFPQTVTQIAGNEIIIKMDESFENVTNKLNEVSENINAAAQNIIAQQNNLQQNINTNQQAVVNVGKQEEENLDLQDGQALHYNRNGSLPVTNSSPIVYRGSKNYRALINSGFVDNGKYLYVPENNIKVDINQSIQLTGVLSKLEQLIAKMDSFDMGTNFGSILTAINGVNTQLQQQNNRKLLSDKVNKDFNSLIQNTQKQLKNMESLEKTFTDFVNLMKATQQNDQSNNISKLITDIKSMVETTNQMYSDIHEKLYSNKMLEEEEPVQELSIIKPKNGFRVSSDDIEGIYEEPSDIKMTKEEFMKYITDIYDDLIKRHITVLDEYQNKIKNEVVSQNNDNNEQLISISTKLEQFINAYNESYNQYKLLFDGINNSLGIVNSTIESVNTSLGNVNTTIDSQTNRLLEDSQITRESDYNNALGIARTVFDSSKLITGNIVSAIDRVNNSILDLPKFTQLLIQSGFEEANKYAQIIYDNYMQLINRPLQINLPPDIVDALNSLASMNNIYNHVAILDDNNNTDEQRIVNADQIRYDIYEFISFLYPYKDNQEFIDFCRTLGFNNMFSAYRVRDKYPYLQELFSKIMRGSPFTHEELQYYGNFITSLKLNEDNKFNKDFTNFVENMLKYGVPYIHKLGN